MPPRARYGCLPRLLPARPGLCPVRSFLTAIVDEFPQRLALRHPELREAIAERTSEQSANKLLHECGENRVVSVVHVALSDRKDRRRESALPAFRHNYRGRMN